MGRGDVERPGARLNASKVGAMSLARRISKPFTAANPSVAAQRGPSRAITSVSSPLQLVVVLPQPLMGLPGFLNARAAFWPSACSDPAAPSRATCRTHWPRTRPHPWDGHPLRRTRSPLLHKGTAISSVPAKRERPVGEGRLVRARTRPAKRQVRQTTHWTRGHSRSGPLIHSTTRRW